MQIKSKVQFSRIVVLSFFLVLITTLAALHQIIGGGPGGVPSVDALCPFGGLEAIYKFLVSGEFLKRTNLSNFVLLGGTIALVIIVGRFFCGWICMLGFLQELFGKLGQKIFKRKFSMPSGIDKYLRYFKYVVFVGVIFLTWKAGDLIIRPYDPYVAWAHIPSGFEVFEEFLIGFIILFASLFLSMFYDRFFCKYICPLGGFLGILNKIGLYKITRDESTCINCKKCDSVCPVNLNISTAERVTSSECINCLQCVTNCPTKKDTLKPTILKTFIRSGKIAVVGLAIYIGIIGTAYAAGYWKTTEGSSTEAVQSGGMLDPSNIRGYMKMAEIAETFNVSVSKLYEKLGITREQYSYHMTMKELVKKSKETSKTILEDDIRNAVRALLIVPVKEGSTHNEKESEDVKKTNSADVKDPADIKGTMSLKEISSAYGVDISRLYEKLKISKDKVAPEMPSREIKTILMKEGRSFEVDEIRKAVKELTTK
jgi:ferredoxin